MVARVLLAMLKGAGIAVLVSCSTSSGVEHGAGRTQPGQRLYVAGAHVSVREGPTGSSGIVIDVVRGQELVVISVSSNWIEVGVAGTGRVGWIPSDAVSDQSQSEAPPVRESDSIRRFRDSLDTLNRRVETSTGVRLFAHAADRGDGIVHVTATDVWLSGTSEDQLGNLKTLHNLWRAASRTDLPLFVNIVDAQGNIRASYPPLR